MDASKNTDSTNSEISSICDRSSFDENSDSIISDPTFDSMSESFSATVSPLRGGSNFDDTINKKPGEDFKESKLNSECVANETSKVHEENSMKNDERTWDLLECTSAALKSNQPDITLDATNSISKSNRQPGTSHTKNSHRAIDSLSDYLTKVISWKDRKVAIITQNVNGPCPLIAILNVLSLRNKISLPTKSDIVSSEKLMEYLGDCILSIYPADTVAGGQHNFEQNVHDAIAILPKLQTGLDVNIRFSGVRDFEYTPECIVFDLLGIPLYHGWLVEHESSDVVKSISRCSYNQLVEKIIENQTSTDPELSYEAFAADHFLKSTASQLTYQGLCELNSTINEDELAVLFRNNHFITVYKHKNELFQLVTDQGFSSETGVVWETLSNIEGDSQFVDGKFMLVPPMADPNINADVPSEQQVDQDYLVALTLQEEQRKQEDQNKSWDEYKHNTLGLSNQITDEELAKRLQEEENLASGSQSTENYDNGRRTKDDKNKKSDCTIL